MRTITFLGVLFMVARVGANGLPTDAEILRVRCGSTCKQSDPPTLQAGIKENQLGVTVEAWAFMYDEIVQTYPHLISGAIWIIGTTAGGETFWDDPLDYKLDTLTKVREHVRQRGYVVVEVGRNRRHNAKLVLPSAIPICQQGPTACEQETSRLTSERDTAVAGLAIVQREMSACKDKLAVVTTKSLASPTVKQAQPTSAVVVSGSPIWPFWLAIVVLIVVVVIQQRIIYDRAHTLKAVARKMGLADPYANSWFLRRWIIKVLHSHVYGYVTHAVVEKVYRLKYSTETVRQTRAMLQAAECETVDDAAERVVNEYKAMLTALGDERAEHGATKGTLAAEREAHQRTCEQAARDVKAEQEAHQHTREQAAQDVVAERAVRQADRDAVFHWGEQLFQVAVRLGVPTTDGYETRLVETLDRRDIVVTTAPA